MALTGRGAVLSAQNRTCVLSCVHIIAEKLLLLLLGDISSFKFSCKMLQKSSLSLCPGHLFSFDSVAFFETNTLFIQINSDAANVA